VTDRRRLAAYRREPGTGQFTPMPDRAAGDPSPAEANQSFPGQLDENDDSTG
jgi:hypothetical protein